MGEGRREKGEANLEVQKKFCIVGHEKNHPQNNKT